VSILTPALLPVKSTASEVMTDAEFSAWCAGQCSPEPAIDHLRDVTKMVDTPYIPTVAERFENSGFEIGWQAGADEWADREAIMAGWRAAEDAGWDRHDVEVDEVGGRYRLVLIERGAM